MKIMKKTHEVGLGYSTLHSGYGYGSYSIALSHSFLSVYLRSPKDNTFRACAVSHKSSLGVNLGNKGSDIFKNLLIYYIFLHRIVKKLILPKFLKLSLEFPYIIMRRVDAMYFYT